MTFVTFTNIVTMILCTAVLVQSVRLMRALKTMRSGEMSGVVAALDASTAQARIVLANLMEVLRVDCAAGSRTIGESKSMLDELTVMTGIANAVAERIVDAAGRNVPDRATDASASGDGTDPGTETRADEGTVVQPAAARVRNGRSRAPMLAAS